MPEDDQSIILAMPKLAVFVNNSNYVVAVVVAVVAVVAVVGVVVVAVAVGGCGVVQS